MRTKLHFLVSGAETSETFFARIAEIFPETDPRYILIKNAYDLARKEFRNKKRDDGTRFFEHLRSVALIGIIYLRIRDADMIAAMLLHDLIEDFPKKWNRAKLELEFNSNVAELDWWVSKPPLGGLLRTSNDVDRAYHHKLSDALATPLGRKAIFIKLCDRLHNLITLWNQPLERMRAKVRETWDFILPFAESLGVLIQELEDVLRFVERRYGF